MLSGWVDAVYIQGSIALDAFNERSSDVDFLTLVGRQATESEMELLREIHRRLEHKYARWPLEGSYLPWSDVGETGSAISPHPNYHEGLLKRDERAGVNAISWWILKNRGITLMGAAADKLALNVDWDTLLIEMKQNLNTY